tara:strand:- start:419 stop:1417 length:999 start_codon:yes stop_codon:yes gene_type:complete
MISKFYEIAKFKEKINLFLFYGENDGQKLEAISTNFSHFNKKNTFKYSEKDILENKQLLFENIYSKSFFENEKLIIITEITDKFLNVILEITESKLDEVKIILLTKKLEKKSKIRNFFEKEERTLIVPFYEDTTQTLNTIARKILSENKIYLSQEQLNLIIDRTRNDRISLKNELEKIVALSKNKKKIDLDDILKLTNLSENYSASELADNCLSKNKRKTLNILNENISTNDDNILILKTFLYKLKRLKRLRQNFNENNDLEKTINSFKPTIFWKDKTTIMHQIKIWDINDIEEFIIDLNNTEYLIKKNPNVSNQIINNMILDKVENSNIQI